MSYNVKHALVRTRSNYASPFRRKSPSIMDRFPAIITLMTSIPTRQSSRNRSANERCFAIGSALIRKRIETIGVTFSIRSWPICANGSSPLKLPQLDVYIQAYHPRHDCRAHWTATTSFPPLFYCYYYELTLEKANTTFVCVFSSCSFLSRSLTMPICVATKTVLPFSDV